MDLLTHHLVELFLFFARFFPWLAYYIARYVAWMESAPRMLLDDSAYILNMNCRVRLTQSTPPSYLFSFLFTIVSSIYYRMGHPI